MNPMPEWWLTASGLFFILGSIFMIVGTVGMGVLIWILLDLRVSIKKLATKVEEISDKVNSVADTVKTVTTEVGTRTAGITRMVDDTANSALVVVEKYAPFILGLAAIFKLAKSMKMFQRNR